MPDAVTDHFPVVADLQIAGGSKNSPGKGLEIVSKHNLASIDSTAFRAELRALGVNDWPAPPPNRSVDELIDDFYSVLNPVIDRHAPERTFKVRRDTPCLYLSKETKEAMKMRDRARQGFGGDYKMLRNKCVKLVRRDRMQTAMKKMSEASNRQAAAWRLADSVLKRGGTDRLPLLRDCKSDAECAEKCNDFFLQKVEKLVSGIKTSAESGETMTNAREFIQNIARETPPFELNCVGIATTKRAIRSMGSTKAIGVDGLPCSFWKEYCEDLAPFVNLMINTSIKTGIYPTLFKDAIVVPVFKGGRKDREDPASYRPISVLPALSKVLETIVIGQFLDYLDENSLLPPAQHGFRQSHSTSTVTALVKTTQKWTTQKGSAIASFDYSAAFDTIGKDTVQQRLGDIGAADNVKTWMASYGWRSTKNSLESIHVILSKQALDGCKQGKALLATSG